MKLKASYDTFDEESDETGLYCPEESLTQQNQEADTNINNIVRRYTQTGELPVHTRPPLQEEFATVTTMQEAANLLIDAKHAFMEQPAAVRNRFNNDPAAFVEFCSNEENRDDMRKMGLMSDEEVNRHAARMAAEQAQRDLDKSDAEAFRKAQGQRNADT